MLAGNKIGGPVANPIREMLDSSHKDGVIFECSDAKRAETTRYAALMLKKRNGYSYKTMRKGSTLTVYKNDVDPYEMHGVSKVRFMEE